MVRVGSMRVESFTTPIKQDAMSGIKRSESVKLDERQKKIKRTPSFTTRKRAVVNRQRNAGDLPPVEIQGFLERKQELQSGGKRATIRSWKTYYTVLCGQLLCFFKDKEGFIDNNASAPPVSLLQARCQEARDYTKKKYVFRIQLMDGAEFLFTAEDEQSMTLWLKKLSFHASLPPSMQLLSYDSQKELTVPADGLNPDLNSSASSQASSPESKRTGLISSHPSGGLNNRDSMQKSSSQDVTLREKSKPAVPQKPGITRIVSEPPPPPTPSAVDSISVKSRIQQFQNASVQNRSSLPAGIRDNGQTTHYTAFTVSGHLNQNGVTSVINNNNNNMNANVVDGTSSASNSNNNHQEYYPMLSPNFPPSNYLPAGPPPLPERPPPSLSSRRAPPRMDESDEDLQFASDNEQERHYSMYRRDHAQTDENYYRQSTPSAKEPYPAHVVRHMSLPAKSQPPGGYLRPAGTLDNRLRTTSSDGSSEGELHQTEKKGKKSMFRLFKKK